LAARYADPLPKETRPLEEAYAKAMKAASEKFRNDADIGALYAESLMNLRPWDLWTIDGKPQPETPEILKALETVLEFAPNHPLANHLYIQVRIIPMQFLVRKNEQTPQCFCSRLLVDGQCSGLLRGGEAAEEALRSVRWPLSTRSGSDLIQVNSNCSIRHPSGLVARL